MDWFDKTTTIVIVGLLAVIGYLTISIAIGANDLSEKQKTEMVDGTK